MARKSTAAEEKNETDIKPTAAADENTAAVETMLTTTTEPNKSIEKRIYTGADGARNEAEYSFYGQHSRGA